MEKSSKILLKYIIDIDREFCEIEKVFQNKNFLPVTKIKVDISSDPVRLIFKAFDVFYDSKAEKIFDLFINSYDKEMSTDEIVDKIEEILK